MKLLSSILAALIFFLTVQPVLTCLGLFAKHETKTIENCCADKQNAHSSRNKKQQTQDHNCCNSGHCSNPFLACANCFFINFGRVVFITASPFIQNGKVSITNDKLLSSFSQDVWHPPKLV